MNPDNFKLAAALVGDTYAKQGAGSLRMQEKLVQNLLTQAISVEWLLGVRVRCSDACRLKAGATKRSSFYCTSSP